MYIDGTAWLFLESLSTGFEVSTRKGHPERMCTTSHFTRCRTTYYEYAYQVPRYLLTMSTLTRCRSLPTMSTLTRCRTTYYEYTYEVARHLL